MDYGEEIILHYHIVMCDWQEFWELFLNFIQMRAIRMREERGKKQVAGRAVSR